MKADRDDGLALGAGVSRAGANGRSAGREDDALGGKFSFNDAQNCGRVRHGLSFSTHLKDN